MAAAEEYGQKLQANGGMALPGNEKGPSRASKRIQRV